MELSIYSFLIIGRFLWYKCYYEGNVTTGTLVSQHYNIFVLYYVTVIQFSFLYCVAGCASRWRKTGATEREMQELFRWGPQVIYPSQHSEASSPFSGSAVLERAVIMPPPKSTVFGNLKTIISIYNVGRIQCSISKRDVTNSNIEKWTERW